jgi:catechol 2,3-dioxygenase-like lactoylglutathione lyase family enzyme
MDVLGLNWVGTRTPKHDETVAFFRDTLGLPVVHAEPDFTVLKIADGATVEVFGPRSTYNQHFSHPVSGFRVRDLAAAADELTAAGCEIVLPIQHGDGGAWLHLRAPDGFVYELSEKTEADNA